jgi:hypothetical protein
MVSSTGTIASNHEMSIEAAQVKLLALLKVGREEHMRELREGKLFCRRLSFYSEIEGALLPHQDPDEGLLGVYQSERINISFQPNEEVDPIMINSDAGLIGEVKVSGNYNDPVFCLHAVHTGDWTHRTFGENELEAFRAALQVPASMDKFGSHVWLITHEEAFLARLRSACAAQGIGFRRGRVRYIDQHSVHGAVPQSLRGFVKLDSFKEEREYRIYFHSARELPDPFILDIGPLHDISHVTTLAEFRQGWQIKFPEV